MKKYFALLLSLLAGMTVVGCLQDKIAVLDPTPTAPTVKTLPASLPEPSLFDTVWTDRELFVDGLLAAERTVLAQLPGATVYHMDLRIAENLVQISGVQEILYTNLETEPLDSIYLHLYLNLLGGSTAISSAELNGAPVSPIYQMGKSILQVPLDPTLLPGEASVLKIEFEGTVPTDVGRNYGVVALKDDILALAHFYPMIAAYDDLGWHIQQPAEHGDIVYADSSFYVVRVTAPKRMHIAASGIEVDRSEDDNDQTVTFAAGPMRDFYLAASSLYLQRSQTVGETRINSYAPEALSDGAAAALEFAAAALSSFNSRFGDYPFVEMDIVATPNLALGIEYPGIFALASRIYDPDLESDGVPYRALLESATAHETAHQWFYSVVGNDQLNEPWVDESLTQYVTWLYYVDQYGEENAQGFHNSFEDRWNRVEKAEIPINLPAESYSPLEYSAIVYGRGALFFDALEQKMGSDSLEAFLKEYYRAHKWGVGSTETLLELASHECRCDLSRIISQWMKSR